MNPVRIEDLLTYRFLSALEVAPDGRHAAFFVKHAAPEADDYASNIHICDLETLTSSQLTRSGKDSTFVWSADGESLYLLSKRIEVEDKSVLFRISLEGGEAEKVATLPHRVEGLFRCDDEVVVYTARVRLDDGDAEEDAEDYEVLEEIPFWMNGKGFTSRKRLHLFRFDRASETVTDLSDATLEIDDVDLRGDRAVVVGRRFDGVASTTHELWLIETDRGARRRIPLPSLRIDAARWLDNGTLVVAASDMAEFGLGQNREIFTIDIESGKMISLTPDWDKTVGNSIAADCRHGGGPVLRVRDGRIFVTVTERTRVKLVRIVAGQAPQIVVESPGSIDAYDVHGDLALTIELRPDALEEVYVYRAGEGQAITDLNAPSLEDRSLSPPEAFPVSSADGTDLDAWVIRPVDFDPSQKYPTVLTIHGGPRAAYGEVFFHQMQAMAGLGYALLISNPHGGSGRGNEFADVRGKYGTIDYDDLMAVVDAAVDRFPFIDGERLGVMGGSYGGFMTNWIIGHTDRFRAAVSQRSIANWIHKFCTTDIGYYFNRDQIGTTPWEDGGTDKMWWHSPLRYADKAATPTLFIHSEQDYRCWLPEGIQMFTALRYHGVDARLVMFREENHELSRSGKPKHRIRRLEEMIAWFDRLLKDGA